MYFFPSLTLACFLLWTFSKAIGVNYELELRNYLKLDEKRDIHTRPVEEHNHTIDVNFLIGVSHITELDETREILTVMVWAMMFWSEPTFIWDPMKFGNLTYINLPLDFVWQPDIVLIQEANYKGMKSKLEQEDLWSMSDGEVHWVTHVTLMSVCPLDFSHFPFDEHDCILEFGSWSYLGKHLRLFIPYSQSREFISNIHFFLEDENNQWEILNSWGQKKVVNFTEEYDWHVLEFHINLKRRSSYFGLTLMTPFAMTMLLTLAGFWFPINSRERLTLGAINLIILTVLSIHLYWVVPRSGSKVPSIVICAGNSMLFTGFSLVLSVITLRILCQPPSMQVPHIVRGLLQGIPAKILGLGEGLEGAKDAGLLSSDISPEDGSESTLVSLDTRNLAKEWTVFIIALNRVAFFCFLLIFLIILFSTIA